MSKQQFFSNLKNEIERIDTTSAPKRNERVIDSFDSPTVANTNGKKVVIFNSNDYLGLRHNDLLKKAEHEASEKYGTGPGAVRFISGTSKVHKDLEKAIARFHGRDDAIVFSSAFATNLAVLFALSKGLTKDSVIDSDVLFLSDSLNHRSIIDGVRLTGLDKTNRMIFEHKNMEDFERILKEQQGKFKRVVVVTDGVFSMLGEYQELKEMDRIIKAYDTLYESGIILVVDDAHGVGIAGEKGRGVEEIYNTKSDVLVGTLGKAFGADGGYATGDQTLIDYFRESCATYIYSNSISPGTASAGLKAIELIDTEEGKDLLQRSRKNQELFKMKAIEGGLTLTSDSTHPIQPILIGDTLKTKKIVQDLFDKGFFVTNISYPIVPKGKDEIRIQLSSTHTEDQIIDLIRALKESYERII